MRVKDDYLTLKLHQATATTFPGLGQWIPNFICSKPIVEHANARVLDVTMLETGVRTSKLITICRISLSHQPLLFPLDKQDNLMPNALWQLVQWCWTENASIGESIAEVLDQVRAAETSSRRRRARQENPFETLDYSAAHTHDWFVGRLEG
jgi:hypothetical protein